MPEFFGPGAASLQEAEKVWQATKKFAEEETGLDRYQPSHLSPRVHARG